MIRFVDENGKVIDVANVRSFFFCSLATCKYGFGWLNLVERVHSHGKSNFHNNYIQIEIATCARKRKRRADETNQNQDEIRIKFGLKKSGVKFEKRKKMPKTSSSRLKAFVFEYK